MTLQIALRAFAAQPVINSILDSPNAISSGKRLFSSKHCNYAIT